MATRIRIITDVQRSSHPQYEPHRYTASFELGLVDAIGHGEGASLDEAIGHLVRTHGDKVGIVVNPPPEQAQEA